MSGVQNMQTEYTMLTRILISLTILGAILSIPIYKYKHTQEQKIVESHKTIQTLQKEIDGLSKESKVEMQKKLDELKQQGKVIESKDQEIIQLKKDLQSKLDNKKRVAEEQQKQSATASAVVISGNKQSWMAAAGIPQHEWGHVDFIVSHESGWNPSAVNAGSGACGLGQQLPCGKWAGAWNDPVAALRAMSSYVLKYGGWAGAVSFWQAHQWY